MLADGGLRHRPQTSNDYFGAVSPVAAAALPGAFTVVFVLAPGALTVGFALAPGGGGGAAIIIASGLYTAHRERLRQRARR